MADLLADSGPTLKRPFVHDNIEPPPAATVLMSSWGHCKATPAVRVSKTWSYEPEYRETSAILRQPLLRSPDIISDGNADLLTFRPCQIR